MDEKPTYEELERRIQELEKIEAKYKSSKVALRNSEAQYRLLFEHANVGIFIAQDGYLKAPNPYLSHILGYSGAELEDQPFSLFIHPEYLPLVKTRHQERLSGKTGLPQTYDFRVISKNGTNIWVQLSTILIQLKGRPATLNFLHDITERKRTEEALLESEESYRRLADNSPDMIYRMSLPEGRYEYISPASTHIFGYPPQTWYDNPLLVRETLHPDYLSYFQKQWKNLLKGDLLPSYEYKIIHKDGSVRWINQRNILVKNEDNCPFAIEGILTDITERKQAEEALQEKTKFLQNIIDTTSDLVAVTDLEGNFKFIGPSHRFLGYDPDSLVSRNVMELVHPDDYQETATAFAEFLANREDGRKVEYRYRRADGDYLWFETVGRFILDDAGNPKEILFSSRDFTARKRAEEALKENEQKFRTIFNSNMDSISLLDLGPDGKPSGFIDCNDAACKILGYSKEELKLKKLEELEIPVPENVMIQRLESLQTKGSVDFETVIKDKNGNDRYVEVKAVQMNLPNQPAIMNISRDITERKQAEAKILYLQKSESLGRMAGAIAHHFNNQLSVVMGNLELVLDDLPDDAENRENLFQAFEAGRKAADKSRQMLRYLGHISGNQTTINLSDVCRQSLVLLQSALQSGVTLNVDFPDSGPFVHADAGQIQQVLTNLFTNAQESVLENQGIIGLIIQTVSHKDISTSNRFPLDWHPQDNPYACIEISDTGCGISKENIVKIFDPFYTTKFTGRGMGLPVTMGILKTHDGCITVDSEPESGTVFRVYLPVTTEKEPVKHEKETKTKENVGNGGTILLIEDETSVRNMAKIMISRLGYKIIEAQDGVEAVRLFQEHQNEIDCVLSDLTMPRMNGWETLTALREKGADIPVILASGYDEDTVMAGDHPELPQAFLNKPYSMAALKDVLMEVIKLK